MGSVRSSRNNLANYYRIVGRNEDSIRLAKQALEGRKRVLGTEHPETLRSQGNLSNSYGAAERYEEAIKIGEQTLKGRERVLGVDHPHTLMSRNNLANRYGDVGHCQQQMTRR